MTLRIVVGAAGLIGGHITRQLAGAPGRLAAVDPHLRGDLTDIEVLRIDCAHAQFGVWLEHAITGHDRVELFYAAGTVPPLRHIADTSPADFADAMAELTRAYTTLSTFAEALRRAGGRGAAVLIGSVGARHAHRYMIGYDAAKAGLESTARSVALEYGVHGITARVLAVGPLAESATTAADGDLGLGLTRLVPLGRYPAVAEIAQMAIAYAAPAFDCANGHTLPADGGLTVQLRPVDVERQPSS